MKTTYLSFILILTLGISQCLGQLKRPERVKLPTSYETYFYELDEHENWQEVDSLQEGGLIIENSFPKGIGTWTLLVRLLLMWFSGQG